MISLGKVLLTAAAFCLAGSAFGQECSLCAKKVVIVPSTAPCLQQALDELASKATSFVTFDLSKCGSAVASRGVVPPLPTAEDPSSRPTIRFILPKSKLTCLADRFKAVANNLNPYAVLDVSGCP